MNKPADPKLKPIHVFVPEELRRKLKIRAAQKGTTMAALVSQAIEREVR